MIDMTNKRLSVAPMIDWTTTDYRYFARLFNPHVYLYTEMTGTGALIYAGTARGTCVLMSANILLFCNLAA